MKNQKCYAVVSDSGVQAVYLDKDRANKAAHLFNQTEEWDESGNNSCWVEAVPLFCSPIN